MERTMGKVRELRISYVRFMDHGGIHGKMRENKDIVKEVMIKIMSRENHQVFEEVKKQASAHREDIQI